MSYKLPFLDFITRNDDLSYDMSFVSHLPLTKEVLNERIPPDICSRFRLSVWSTLGGTLALRAKSCVCFDKVS